jgi:PKD domain
MPRYRTLALTPLLAAAALALPGAASATTFCVNAPDCPAGGVSTGGDLQAALDGAAAHIGADTVLVGDKGSPYRGPFTYLGDTVAGDPLTISADGGRPVLTAGVGDTVLTLADATLDGIDVAMPSAAEGTGVAAQDSTLHDVTVSSAASQPGADGIVAVGQTVLDHVRVTATGDRGLVVGEPGESIIFTTVTAQNLQISGSSTAVAVNRGARFSATQSQLTGVVEGLVTQGSTELDRVAVATTDSNSTGIIETDGNVGLTHVTVAHEGPKIGTDTALSLRAVTSNPSLGMLASALAGYTHGIQRTVTGGHTFSFASEQSVWDSAGDQLGGASAGAVHEVGDVHVEPALVNLAAGDLRPRGTSAQIDLDTVTDPSAYTDLVGTPTVDGNGDGTARPDAGALEYRRQAPTIDTIAPPAGGSAGTPLAFNAAVSDADGDHLQVRWDFGDGTAATDTAASHAYAAPGSYQGALTVANESGLSERRTFTVNISPGTPTGTMTGGAPGGTTGGTPPAPQVRLVLRGLRLSSSRISLKRAANLRLRFGASETATIRILLTRRVGRHTITQHAFEHRVNAGNDSIALASALRKLRLLKPGRLTLTITASDIRGNHTQPRTLELTLVR